MSGKLLPLMTHTLNQGEYGKRTKVKKPERFGPSAGLLFGRHRQGAMIEAMQMARMLPTAQVENQGHYIKCGKEVFA